MHPSSRSLVAVGDAVVDLVGQVDQADLDRVGLVRGTRRVVSEREADRLAGIPRNLRVSAGGSASNSAVVATALGVGCTVVGKVGRDAPGRRFAGELADAGVAFPVPPDAATTTSKSVILVTPDGERTMNTFLGASNSLSATDVPPEVGRADMLLVEAYLWGGHGTKAAATRAMELVRASGGRVALTLSDPACVTAHGDELIRWASQGAFDVIFAAEAEILALFRTDDLTGALDQLRRLPATGVVTRSEKGAVVAGTDVASVPPAPVRAVVDATGAGDAFAGGFLAAYLGGTTALDAARTGCDVAARVVEVPGARPPADLRTSLVSATTTGPDVLT